MRRKWVIGLIVLALLALGLLAARIFLADRRLTAMPEQRAGEAVAHDEASFVAVSIRLRHDALSELLDEQFPARFEIPQTTLVGGRSSTTAVQGGGQVERTAPIEVSGHGAAGVEATTRLRGVYTLGNSLLGNESLETEAIVTLSMAFDIDERWAPVVAMQPAIEWITPPQSRLTRMFNVQLEGLAEQQARAIVGRIEQRLPALIEERFRLSELIHRAWDASHTQLQLSQAPAAWLDIQPLGAHFLTPSSQADALQLNTGFSARLSVGPAARTSPTPTAPLPPLSKTAPTVEGVRLAVPVTIPYQTLSDWLAAALRAQEFSFDAGGMTSTVRIDEVTIYPSAPRIVVGLHVESSLTRQWLDTRGWIYVSATPVFDATSGVLELTDLAVARALDNRWINVFSAALEQRLVQELTRLSRFELGAQLESATAAANELLRVQLQQAMEQKMGAGPARLAERISIEGGIRGIESVSFTLAEESLTLYPVVTGSLSVVLVPLQQQLSNREGLQ